MYPAATGKLLIFLLVFQAGLARADLTEGQVRAGFLYNVAKFVEWPASAFSRNDSPLVLCTHALRPEVDSAVHLLSGRLVGERVIRLEREPEKTGECHILYLGKVSPAVLRERVSQSGSVLVVSDEPGTIRQGAAVEIFMVGKRLAFSVNLSACRRAKVKPGAPLLRLAHEVVQP